MKALATVFILGLFYSSCIGQEALTKNQLAKLDSIATQDVPENAPGIATAIIQDGKVLYERYAGLADLDDSTSIKNASRFNIASTGKQFTALAILKLIDERKLKLSDDIQKWFPELYPATEEKITVRHLLSHSSGIRDCYDLWSLQGITWWEQSYTNQDVLRLIARQKDLNFELGTQYLYSNTNYILLALLVEKVSGKSFREYTDGMFRQLNMPDTHFEDDYSQISGPIARSYFIFDTWTTYDWIWNVVGDGNIFSTLEDQIQWEKLVQGEGKTTFSRKRIARSQQLIKGASIDNYGYGLEFGKYRGLNYKFHEGATGAWKATVLRFPEENIFFLTLTNSGKAIPSSQTRQLADVFFNLNSAQTPYLTKPAQAGKYVSENELTGIYLTESDFAFTFELRNGKVFLKRVGRSDVELEREADNVFRQKYDPDFRQEFTKNSEGSMEVTVSYPTHAPYSLTKANLPEEGFDFRKPEGNYFNEETNTSISIKHLAGNNYEITLNEDYKTSGLLVSENKMLVDFYNLEFAENGFLLNGDRIKRVKFRKK
jgi:CubicO group peptidase (beta-lactamase class C family)